MVLKQLCVYVENSAFQLYNMWLLRPWEFIRLSWLYLKVVGSNWGQKTEAHIKYANSCAGRTNANTQFHLLADPSLKSTSSSAQYIPATGTKERV